MASTQNARAVDYRSRFRSWYERASVRAKPRRIVESLEEDKLFFPPELVPVATHPLVSEQGEEVARRVLLRRLYLYLDFTADLEEIAGLTKVFFTVVSETLISAILSDIPHDQRVVGAVRAVIADHAEDEGRHH